MIKYALAFAVILVGAILVGKYIEPEFVSEKTIWPFPPDHV